MCPKTAYTPAGTADSGSPQDIITQKTTERDKKSAKEQNWGKFGVGMHENA
jgi:hypothetical protein